MPRLGKRHRVVVLAYDGLCTFEFGVAVEVFALQRPELGVPWYDFRVAATDRGPLRALGGVRLLVNGGIELLARADTIVVPGWKGSAVPVPEALRLALIRAHRRGARIASICSGVFVLAAAGLLDGRRATTHWRYIAELKKRHPAIAVEPNVLYVDEGKILTSAGSAAGLDLLLHMVRKDHGVRIANAVARRLVIPPHRDGGQAQFIVEPVPLRPRDHYASLLQHVSQNLARPHSVSSLASWLHVSERTLMRGFRNATGLSPMQWIIRARVRKAQELLETSRHSVERVAEQAGFGAVETLRYHFRRITGATPLSFRRAFSA
jgi:AraC family transcriptional activator FtrA